MQTAKFRVYIFAHFVASIIYTDRNYIWNKNLLAKQ